LPAERAGTHIVERVSEIGVIEHVKSVGSKLKVDVLRETELPPESEIDLDQWKTANGVSTLPSLPYYGRNRERRRVEPLTTRGARI
jgi:hypothetical protein